MRQFKFILGFYIICTVLNLIGIAAKDVRLTYYGVTGSMVCDIFALYLLIKYDTDTRTSN